MAFLGMKFNLLIIHSTQTSGNKTTELYVYSVQRGERIKLELVWNEVAAVSSMHDLRPCYSYPGQHHRQKLTKAGGTGVNEVVPFL